MSMRAAIFDYFDNADLSDRQIAQAVGCDCKYVQTVRAQRNRDPAEKRRGRVNLKPAHFEPARVHFDTCIRVFLQDGQLQSCGAATVNGHQHCEACEHQLSAHYQPRYGFGRRTGSGSAA